MEEKRLDLDAPLLSVRRFAYVAPAAETPSSSPPSRRKIAAFPSQRPVGIPGMVPFLWEQSAGRRKGGEEPTVEKASLQVKKKKDEEEDDIFTDAGSCFVSCNRSSVADDIPHSGRLSSENNLKDFVMGRFLPAAQAIASISPQSFLRNAAERRRRGLSPRISGGGGESEIGEEGSKKTSDSPSWPRGFRDDVMLLHPCEKIVCVDSNHETGEKESNEDEAVDSENQRRSGEVEDPPPGIILLPPPLPESPSDSWLRRILPTMAAKGSTLKPTVGPLSRSHRLENLGPERAVVIPRIGD